MLGTRHFRRLCCCADEGCKPHVRVLSSAQILNGSWSCRERHKVESLSKASCQHSDICRIEIKCKAPQPRNSMVTHHFCCVRHAFADSWRMEEGCAHQQRPGQTEELRALTRLLSVQIKPCYDLTSRRSSSLERHVRSAIKLLSGE
jgi:hypothetical protein